MIRRSARTRSPAPSPAWRPTFARSPASPQQWGQVVADRGPQSVEPDLRPTAEVRQHRGDGPLAGARQAPKIFLAQALGERGRLVVFAAQRGDDTLRLSRRYP